MKQVYLSPTGQILLKDLEAPVCKDDGILVRTEYSLISTGTESSVIAQFRKNGVEGQGSNIALGYSNAGTVIEVGPNAKERIKVGDRVACAGGGHASHSEICYVPNNLFVKLPENVSEKEAAFNALAAIALHGFRRGEACLGDWVTVIGLGMIGLLTVQFAKIAGTKVIAIDLAEDRLALAKSLGADYCINGSQENAIEKVIELTNRRGADVSIVCAGSPNSSKPLCDAIEMCREKGKVVMVGLVKLDFPRDTLYNKEIDLLISRSYGPGRYDLSYEEEGHDYPYGYVRWTENRNMEAYIDLLSAGKIDVQPLISYISPIDQCQEVYENIINASEKPIAVLLKY